MLELTLQQSAEAYAVYMINRESEWITDQVHIEAIILEDSQKLTFDVLNLIKYDIILGCPDYAKRTQELIESAKNYTSQ
jgi:hypothetical protein